MLQLRTGEAYLNFTGTLRTKATEKHYLFLIQRYAAFRKTFDLDQIIEQDSSNPKLAAAHIRHFLSEIQTTIKLSPGSVHNYRHALRHFYEMNDLTLNWKKISKFSSMEDSAGMRQKDRAYTHQEIQAMLAHSSEKVRAIILLLASSGIRVGAIYPIKLKHLKRAESRGLYQLLVYPGHKDEYITFCTPEATQAIDSYLSYRQRAGEKLNDDSPLFRTDFYAADKFRVRNNIKPMSTASVSKAVQAVLRSAGLIAIDTVTDTALSSSYHSLRHEVQRNHGFRKFANTQMVLAEVNGAAKEMLLGHSIGLDDKYYRPTPGQLFDEYAKAVDLLTINEENRLRRKVDVYSKTLESEKQKDNRISVLENKMQSLISTLSQLREQGQVNTVAQTLYSSGILKEGFGAGRPEK